MILSPVQYSLTKYLLKLRPSVLERGVFSNQSEHCLFSILCNSFVYAHIGGW